MCSNATYCPPHEPNVASVFQSAHKINDVLSFCCSSVSYNVFPSSVLFSASRRFFTPRTHTPHVANSVAANKPAKIFQTTHIFCDEDAERGYDQGRFVIYYFVTILKRAAFGYALFELSHFACNVYVFHPDSNVPFAATVLIHSWVCTVIVPFFTSTNQPRGAVFVLAHGFHTMIGEYEVNDFHQKVTAAATYAGGSFISAISGEAVGAFGLFGVFFGALGEGVGVVFGVLLPQEFPHHHMPLFGFFLSPSLITCILTYGVHSSIPHIFSIEDLLKSIALLYFSKLPVSSITTSVDNPVLVLVTFTIVQNGNELCAAKFDDCLKTFPLAVFCPLKSS